MKNEAGDAMVLNNIMRVQSNAVGGKKDHKYCTISSKHNNNKSFDTVNEQMLFEHKRAGPKHLQLLTQNSNGDMFDQKQSTIPTRVKHFRVRSNNLGLMIPESSSSSFRNGQTPPQQIDFEILSNLHEYGC